MKPLRLRLNEQQYRNNYARWESTIMGLGDEFRAGRSTYTAEQLEIVGNKLAKQHGLIVDGDMVINPDMIFKQGYEKGKLKQFQQKWNLKRKKGQIECESWQNKYNVPQNSRSSSELGECGKGCFCLDKGIDKDIADKFNTAKNVIPVGVCDGAVHANNIPQAAFRYMGNDNNKLLQTIKPLCSIATVNISKVGERKQNGRKISLIADKKNICTGESDYIPEIDKHNLSDKRTIVNFLGKQKSSRDWWKQVADSLSKL